MAPKSQADPAWQHGVQLEKANHWQCIHCNMIYRGGGVTRLKAHLTGTSAQQAEFDRRATQEVDGGNYESRGGGDEEDVELEAGIRASLEHAAFERDHMYYPGSHFEYSIGSGSGGTSSVSSTSVVGSMDRSGYLKAEEAVEEAFVDSSQTSEQVPDSRKCNQQSILSNHGVYHPKGIGPGIAPPTSYEILCPYLEAEVDEIKKWIDGIKRQWGEYRCSLMCDSWTGLTRVSIINFLIYCNRRVVYHKSVNSSDEIHDSYYISKLMTENVVQVITDNGANFKRAGEIIEHDYPHIYWTPCAVHCVDLMMKDIGDIPMVKSTVKKAQQIIYFIYNHTWVHALMKNFAECEILRPRAARFATNFIALRLLQQKKAALRTMFTKPLYKVLRQVDMEKTPQMGHLYRYIHQAQEEIKRVMIAPTKYEHFIEIISRRWDNQMGCDIYIAGYYLNPAYLYKYDLGTVDSLLYPLRKVIQRMSGSHREVAQALNESKWFRDLFAISIRDTMDPAEWWLQFGTKTPTLRKIATRILSQTTSSSGCERNWSTFALIHTKPRNRLSYARLEKLNEDRDIPHVDPFDVKFVQSNADPIIDWWIAMETGPPLLDEPGEPPRPSPIISDVVESESQLEDTNSQALERDMTLAPLDSQRVRQVRRRSTSNYPSSQSKGKKKAEPSPSKANDNGKGKGKGKRPIDHLDAIEEVEEDKEDEPSVHSSSSTEDGGDDDDDDGAGGENNDVPSTPTPTDLWANEQYFDHYTQDQDHVARTGGTTWVYE
ncbi:hypothetical protein Cni_G19441 [Canna indica]|uniref:BED-type domain-containing protein n=1 Tax=Canna indica TaxID=4628 RepID=A0AAQ3KRL1_9LILI|nr:hypothetical protein Cni_G19441 [Canna indica]